MGELSHLDDSGSARMVDVSHKPVTNRRALARGVVRMSPATAAVVESGDAPKGDVAATARLAGIQAAKRTADLIPLCHPLALSFVDVQVGIDAAAGEVTLTAETRTSAQTGVEMEAMTACAVAALTVYDMVKGVERGVEVGPIVLIEKSVGGATGGADDRPAVKAAVLTISTSLARGEGEDLSGPALASLCEAAGLETAHELLPDDRPAIAAALRRLADEEDVRFVFTTGGTGMTPDDVTPEATRDAIEREAPGYAETIRAESRRHTPLGILARGVAGIRGRTLIVNLPGNPKAIGQSWPVIEPTLRHAAETLERGS